MPNCRAHWIFMLVVAFSVNAQAEDSVNGIDSDSAVRLGGYLKTIYQKSRTADPEDRPYDLSLTRLRLIADAGDESSLSAHLELDTELRLGNYLETEEFTASLELPNWQYAWGGDYELASDSDSYLSQRFYRAYARGAWDDMEIIAGRQRIPLGTGRWWSALDLLNANNPVRIEMDERIGVDAVRVEYKAGSITRWVYIAAPDPLEVSTRQLVQFGSNAQGVDVIVTAGDIRKDILIGVDFATQFNGAGVYGEAVHTRADIGEDYQKYVLGADYGFVNGLTLTGELYRSTQAPEDVAATIATYPELPYLQPTGRNYLGFSANYEPIPIYKITVMWLSNQDDDSRFSSASFTWSLRDDIYVSVGGQSFEGESTSDYGRGKTLLFSYLQWYF